MRHQVHYTENLRGYEIYMRIHDEPEVNPGGNPEKSTWSWMVLPFTVKDIRSRSRMLAYIRKGEYE